MSAKAELAFDVCWDVYRAAREVLETKRGVSALNWNGASKFLWRPDLRPRLNDWVADFALAGQAALEDKDRASRMVLFRLYYLGLAPYEKTRHFLGLSEMSWVSWTEEVRRSCGAELLRRGMFPPRGYFGATTPNKRDEITGSRREAGRGEGNSHAHAGRPAQERFFGAKIRPSE
jgi:hypothetical protein